MEFQPLTYRGFQWAANVHKALPLVIGIVLTGLFGVFALWCSWLIGTVADVDAGRQPSIAVRAPVTLYMMLGYLPLAIYYLGTWTEDHLRVIVREFGLDNVPFNFPRRSANWVGVIGVLVTYFSFLFRVDSPWLIVEPMEWPPEYVLILVGLVTLGWFNFRFVYLLVRRAMTISATATRIRSINLFDLSLIKPYAQHGVRSSLLAIVSLSISANLWLDPESKSIGSLSTVGLLVAAAVIALFLPTWGIHKRLGLQKQAELQSVRAAISARTSSQGRSLEQAQQLSANLALERRLMDISEWPFDAGSYGRVALYVFLGFGSWVGAALVERLLESL